MDPYFSSVWQGKWHALLGKPSGFVSLGPNPDRRGAILVADKVVSLNVRLGSTPNLSHIGVDEWGFEEGAPEDFLDVPSPWLN
jgi:hypothetical protein